MNRLVVPTVAAVLAAAAPLAAPSPAEANAPQLAELAGTFPPSVLTFAQCTSRGAAALAKLGFKKTSTTALPTIAFADGHTGNYSASLICGRGGAATVSTIVVAGPVQARADEIAIAIADRIVLASAAAGASAGWSRNRH